MPANEFLISMSQDLYRWFWTLLARELDSALALQIVGRSAEMIQDEVLWVLRRKGGLALFGGGEIGSISTRLN